MSLLDPPTFPWTVFTGSTGTFVFVGRTSPTTSAGSQTRSLPPVAVTHMHACARGCPGNRYWHLQEVFLASRRASQREGPGHGARSPHKSLLIAAPLSSLLSRVEVTGGGRALGHRGRVLGHGGQTLGPAHLHQPQSFRMFS